MRIRTFIFLVTCCFVSLITAIPVAHAQDGGQSKRVKSTKEVPTYDSSVPKPTLAGIPYGKHERQILDFWQAPSDKPTPLVFVIHGGGWIGGSKERLHRFVETATLLKAGISVVAINYRLLAHTEGVTPPVKASLHDAARALQFIRTKANEWNIDKARIGAVGGSAGGASSLWLAYHDDLASPKSEDLVARESTRLWCVAAVEPQTTLDPKQMKEWTPNSYYGGHAFGFVKNNYGQLAWRERQENMKNSFPQFLAERERILPWIAEYSPYALLNAGDPPTYLLYGAAPAIGRNQEDPTHTSNFGVKLQERCVKHGVECELVYSEAPNARKTLTYYLIATLKSDA